MISYDIHRSNKQRQVRYLTLFNRYLRFSNLIGCSKSTAIFTACDCLQVCMFQTSLSLRRHAHRPLAERLMHMAHKSGNTSGVSKLSSDWLNYTGFLGDVCVVFFNIPPGNKDAVTPNPLAKEESRRVYNFDDKLLPGSTRRWIFKSMWNI